MILNQTTLAERYKKRLHDELNHPHHCNCEHHKGHKHHKKIERFDDQAEPYIVPLEEHFENFADSVVEVAENFLRGKKGRERRDKRIERKEARKDARQEKRISRIKGREDIRQEKVKQEQLRTESLQAKQQADQTNQLASQVQPTSQPVSPSQVPQGTQDSSGGGQLYKTLPDYQPPMDSGLTGMSGGSGGGDFALEPEQPKEETSKGTEATKVEEQPVKKKSNVVLYLVIVAVVIGAVYLMKKK